VSGFFIFIFIFVLLYYGSKLFFRYGLPWLIMHFVRKQQDKFNNGFGQEEPFGEKEEGEMRVKTQQESKGKTDDKDFGEYVDFEEIDESE